ncbi:MAG: hypothetical protein HZC36_06360 [Armatimonadetes bacterium]|nr:hypothetical protein [Armatimonadota bacterium]
MDSSELVDLFGAPLECDPAIALNSDALRLPIPKTGPLPMVQFQIEIVGPRSMKAAPALAVLDEPWRSGLGYPEVFVMDASDSGWRSPTRPEKAATLDSLVLCWDYLSAKGTLSANACARLVHAAEPFAKSLDRRAMPMPLPQDVDRKVADLKQRQEALDIGFEVGVISGTSTLSERQIWRTCAALGLDLAANGAFVWRAPGWSLPLLSVASWDDGVSFGLDGARADRQHEAIGVGFNVPTNPDPVTSLNACFQVAEALATALGALATDDEGRPYTRAMRAETENAMAQALEAFRRAGLEPGSPEAIKLFPTA